MIYPFHSFIPKSLIYPNCEKGENPTNLIAKEKRCAPVERVGRHRLRIVGDLHAADVTAPLILHTKTQASAHGVQTNEGKLGAGKGARV